MNYGEVGIIDSIAYSFGLLMEVPTGAISDMVGKKKTINLAMIFGFLGIGLIGMAQNRYYVFAGFMLAQIGWAFYSGAMEALVYDSLIENGKEKAFDKVIGKAQSLGLISGVAAMIIGLFLYKFNPRLAYVGWSMAYLTGFIISLRLTEPAIDSEIFSWKNYKKSTCLLFIFIFSIRFKIK